MKARNVKVVLHASGENKGTYDILGELKSIKGTIDLNEKVDRFVSWDCNIPTSVPRYKVATIQLPKWLTFDEWNNNHIAWKYTWGMGVSKEWSENRQRKMFSMMRVNKTMVLAITKIVNSRPRKDSRKKLKDQVTKWLDSKSQKFNYDNGRLLINKWLTIEANQIDSQLYRQGL